MPSQIRFIALALLACGCGSPRPAPTILHPTADRSVDGVTYVAARQTEPGLSDFEIRRTRFELSTDGDTWRAIGELSNPWDDTTGMLTHEWDVVWDTRALAPGPYRLRAIMESDDGAVGSSPTLTVTVEPPSEPRAAAQEEAADECLCQSISLRGDDLPAEGKALGPDGVPGGSGWFPDRRHDGNTAGPLHDNLLNLGEPERGNYGSLFEIECTYTGNADRCRQVQLKRGLLRLKGIARERCEAARGDGWTFDEANQSCDLPAEWTGNAADRDLDGVTDPGFRLGDERACDRAGGRWDGSRCTLAFPLGGRFGPDNYESSAIEPKVHLPPARPGEVGQILWRDVPSFHQGANGTTWQVDFIALVRGTDGKYCYVAFTLDVERREGRDKEALRVTGSGNRVDIVPHVTTF